MSKDHPTNRLDLTGTTFGHWTVLGFSHTNGRRLTCWLCRCQCGKERVQTGTRLTSGRTTRCHSCGNREGNRGVDYSGRKFGLWTVLSLARHNPNRARYFNCRCECGAECVVSVCCLTGSQVSGCKACRDRKSQKIAYAAMWARINRGAKDRRIELTITRDYAYGLLATQAFRCALSGLPIEVAGSTKAHLGRGTTASLDRIDSSRGYVDGNVQWVHKDLNRMKWNFDQDKFVAMCRLVADRFPSPS